MRGIAPRSSRVQVRVAGPGFSYEAVGGAFHRENPSTSVKALITFAWLWRLEKGRPRRCAVSHPRHPRHKSRFPRLSGTRQP